MGLLDDVRHGLLDNETLHFAGAAADVRDEDERWLVTLGAPLAAFNGDPVDSVGVERDAEALRAGLADVWDVSDRASFERVAQGLYDSGQRSSFDAVWRGILAMDAAARSLPGWLRTVIDDFAPQFHEFKIDRRFRTQAVMADSGFTMKEVVETRQASRRWLPQLRAKLGVEPEAVPDLVAWDAVRLVNLTRWAVRLGFIERAEFAPYAGGLASRVQETYAGWAQVSAAYVAGGLIWQHSNAREESLLRTNAMLVADPRSPYRAIEFR